LRPQPQRQLACKSARYRADFCFFAGAGVFFLLIHISRGDYLSCPICEKRKAVRFCPSKGEKICAVCCGTEHEVSITCPVDCGYLLAAHRYEDEHRRSLPADTPLLDEKIPQAIVHAHQQLMSAIAFSVAKFCAVQPLTTDPDVLQAIQALAETHRTRSAGILYEKAPEAPLPRELYAALGAFLAEVKKQQAERAGAEPIKDQDVFYLLVFLYRMGLLRTNGRPRSRRFIEFLRGQFPQTPELQRGESRIIVP
jgi:hypothetical protein